MYSWILGLHSLLRWGLLFALLFNLIRMNVESKEQFVEKDRKWSIVIYIFAIMNLIAAVYLYFFGSNGIEIIDDQKYTMQDVMHTGWLRYWIIEHPLMMLTALLLIIISHRVSRREIEITKKTKAMRTLYVVALVIIIVAAPWPFRGEGIARPAFRALY